MTAQNRSQQKKAEKHRRKREQARQAARKQAVPGTRGALLRLASAAPFGPCWVSDGLWDTDADVPSLVTVVVTRVLPGQLLLAHLVLVDRTCLGVKNAVVSQPLDESTLHAEFVNISPDYPMSPCELIVAQSVIYHAIDYARSLGFEPHRDFHASLLGPRPEQLVSTPLATPSRPYYVAGPDDIPQRIMRQLEAVVGSGGYDLLASSDEP